MSGEQAMEDWQNKVDSLSLRAKFAFDHKILTDCEFTFGRNDKVSCHKLVLAMTSPVFHAMFYGEMRHDDDHSIEITDIEPQVFKQMVQYIYVGHSSISDCMNACELYHAAKKYILLNLEKQCIDYILKHLDKEKENVIQVFEFAQFHSEKALKSRALMEIQCHATSILKDASLLQASEATLMTLLELERLNISSECQLLAAVERWAHARITQDGPSGHTLRELAKPLTKKLRLLTVSQNEFVTGVASSSLLNDSEKLSVLLRIIETDYPPMANGLCEERSKRKPWREIMKAIFQFQRQEDVEIYEDEVYTSIFTTDTRITLLGIELNLQKSKDGGLYKEDLMVEVGLAENTGHIAKASLVGNVRYNTKRQVMFPNPPVLETYQKYAIRVFLYSLGIYPLGYNSSMSCVNNDVKIKSVSHRSSYLDNQKTVLCSLVYQRDESSVRRR